MTTTTERVRLADAPKIGEYWPGQGGLYAGVIPDYEGHDPRVLIVGDHEAVEVAWGGSGDIEASAKDKRDGDANTRDLVNCREVSHLHQAARFAVNYEKDGHDDFHLPSKRELDVVYVTMRDTFDQTDWYWSSTEESASLAWGRHFGGADVNVMLKHMPGRAIAVRTVPIKKDADCTVNVCTIKA